MVDMDKTIIIITIITGVFMHILQKSNLKNVLPMLRSSSKYLTTASERACYIYLHTCTSYFHFALGLNVNFRSTLC